MVVGSAAILVVSDDQCIVLICVRCVGIDIQVELCDPLLAIGHLIILRELSPPACGEIGGTDGIYILMQTFDDFLTLALIGFVNGVDLGGDPIWSVDTVEVTALTARQSQQT